MTGRVAAALVLALLAGASNATSLVPAMDDDAHAATAGRDVVEDEPALATGGRDAIVEVHFAMGTPIAITARGDDEMRTRAAIRAAFREIRRLETLLTAWDPDSATSRVNRDAGDDAIEVPAELSAILDAASRLTRRTDGAFSVLVGPIVDLWRAAEPGSPDPAALANAVGLTRGDGLLHDGDHVALRRSGMRLDLDGIAKGFAADRAIALLRGSGVAAAIVDLGGSSMAAFGDAGDGARGWPVELPLPASSARTTHEPTATGAHARGAAIDGTRDATTHDATRCDPTTHDATARDARTRVTPSIRLVDEALSASASGTGEASDDDAPPRRRVIVDPRTGDRIARDATAVVVHASATDAEAWSKALLVRGWAATSLLARHGGEAILRYGADAPRCSPRFRNLPGVCKVLRPAAASSARPRSGQEKPCG